MVRIRCEEDFKREPAIIKVIGLGGAGGNAINRMVEAGVEGVEFLAANTDAQALRASKAPVRIQLGEEFTRGLGVGGDPKKGRLASEESKERLREVLAGADLVFITAGMGGGTGTGSAPLVAQLARETNALTLGVVTRPFHFEGQLRASMADGGIRELRACVDATLIIPNDRLLDISSEATPATEAFRMADEVLRQAIQSISDVITRSGNINMDLNDIKAIMAGAGDALMGVGEAEGPSRAVEAVRKAVASPLLENVSIEGARGIIVNFVGDRLMTLSDMSEAMRFIHGVASPEARIKMGQVEDPEMGKRLRVTVIATGFPARKARVARTFGRLTQGSERRPVGGDAPALSQAPTAEELSKPAFARWKLRKLR